MPETATDPKSPKTPRRLKTGGEPLRQVHFQSPGNHKTSSSASPGAEPEGNSAEAASGQEQDNQPENFPQLGGGQWYTSADPTQSVKLPGQPFPGAFPAGFAPAPHHPHFFAPPHLVNVNNAIHGFHPFPHPHLPAPVAFIGIPHPHLHPHQQPLTSAAPAMAADYQNAAPLPTGVNFQPPVPDTTFGPIPHVYVPRFDGGFVPAGVQVGLPPPVQFVSAPAYTATTTVIMPKTFYHNGYTYYQPTVAGVPVVQPGYVVAQQPAGVPQPIMGQQPVMINGQPMMAPFQHMQAGPPMGVGAGGVPVIAGNNGGQIPEVSGLGRTPAEETVRQLQFAHSNKLFEPQEFKPSDDDPSRFYYVREVDGNWTQRNRFTIDHFGDCRWYVTDEGWFYAIRLPS